MARAKGIAVFTKLRRKIILGVMAAAKRGNPMAKRVVAKQVRGFLETLPQTSPIVRGHYMIPDLDQPLPADLQGGMMGDYEMVALTAGKVTAEALQGRQVKALSCNLGSYGMGGYGFFGMLLDEEWLIVPIHAAATWIELDGRLLEGSIGSEGHPKPWITDADDTALIARLAEATITGATLGKHAFDLRFDNGAVLQVAEDPSQRPKLPGTGLPRAFLDSDDLAEALFFSPLPDVFV